MKTHTRPQFVMIVLVLFALLLSAVASQPARAAGPWYVAPGGNDANTCLSSAVPCASINGALNQPGFMAGDTIRVATGIYTGTGGADVVLLNKSATLSGGWDAAFSAQSAMSTINGQGARRGITVSDTASVVIERFVVQNGFSPEWGGGVFNAGVLTIDNSLITGSATAESYSGGGIFNQGTLILTNSTVSGNTAGGGGGILNTWMMTVTNSVVTSNTATVVGGGIRSWGNALTIVNSVISGNISYYGGGIDLPGSKVVLNDSIVSHNVAVQGGGIRNDFTYANITVNDSAIISNTASEGGGIFSSGGAFTLSNTTVSGNATSAGGSGGGIYNGSTLILNASAISSNTADGNGGGIHNGGDLHLNNSTVSGNAASEGGGIYNWLGTSTLNNGTVSGNQGGGVKNYAGTVTLRNSVIAGNTSSSNEPDCSGTIDSAGYNLIGSTMGCTFQATTSDWQNVQARLGPFQGSPGYHPLLVGSPAINGGNSAGCADSFGNPLNTDQRGMPRVGRCDIGAYEYQGIIRQVFLPAVARNFCASQFFDDFSNSASGWPSVDTGNVQYEYLSGEYRILLRNAYWWAGATPDVIAANSYNVSVDVRNATGVYGSYGFMFGVSSDGGQFYTFEIDRDGFWVIWRFSYGEWTLLAVDSSGSIATGTATNHLKLERNGALMNVYANSVLLASLSDGAYTGERGVGVFATSYDQGNVDVRFDNFDVCGVAASTSAMREASDATPVGTTLNGWGSLGRRIPASAEPVK